MAHFKRQAFPLCWRNCGNAWDIFHILWKCPILHSYWHEIFEIISEVAHNHTPSPDLALLNWNIESIDPSTRHSVTHNFVVARLSITRIWKNSCPPTVSDTLELFYKHSSYKLMIASSKGLYENTLLLWQPLLQWLP